MHTRLARSADGLQWTLGDAVLEPRPGEWDARGAGSRRCSVTTP